MQLCYIQLLYATKLHFVWWEVSFSMLHETCCLELDQWSNQATPLHRVWHALEHTHLHCPFHVRDCVLQHHNEVLAQLTGVSTRLEVRGDVVANNHVQRKCRSEFELERRQLKVEDHIEEERSLFGWVEGELCREAEGISPL